jgi:hypothetical protein
VFNLLSSFQCEKSTVSIRRVCSFALFITSRLPIKKTRLISKPGFVASLTCREQVFDKKQETCRFSRSQNLSVSGDAFKHCPAWAISRF